MHCNVSKVAATICLVSVVSVVAITQQPIRERVPVVVIRQGTPWGPGCNDELLSSEFALDEAPQFDVTPAQQTRIDAVISELSRGYGGTLVCDPRDAALDSPAFLAMYLRAFSRPDTGIASYDYRFERIMGRLSQHPDVLKEPRLDWDVWRAFLIYENFTDGTGKFKEGNTIYNLDSAADLLWIYLDVNSQAIKSDKSRLEWWIDMLSANLHAPGGRPLRRWLLLELVATTDTETRKLAYNREDGPGIFPTLSPNPYRPFLIVGHGWHLGKEFGDPSPVEGPPFQTAIAEIANSQGLAYEVWDVSGRSLPPTKIWAVDLAPRLTQISMADVIDQESWSMERQDFSVSFWRSVGSRSGFSSVYLPAKDSFDGVFFFVYNVRLYVWPKSRMDDGVIQMLHRSRLIDSVTLQAFHKKVFVPLPRTMVSD